VEQAESRPAALKRAGVLRKTLQVLVERGHLAVVQPEQHLGLNQTEHRFGVGIEPGVLLQVVFNANGLALSPTLRLLGTEGGE
jgi:hypothetical protein